MDGGGYKMKKHPGKRKEKGKETRRGASQCKEERPWVRKSIWVKKKFGPCRQPRSQVPKPMRKTQLKNLSEGKAEERISRN